MRKIVLLSFLLIQFIVSSQTIRYVKEGGSGNKSGSSWDNASGDIQAMINASKVWDHVWVANGTYSPNRKGNALGTVNSGDRKNSFVLKDGVQLYGGFKGSETVLSDRQIGDIRKNGTILNGNNSCYHVVVSVKDSENTLIDGFVVTGGRADIANNAWHTEGVSVGMGVGAGMMCRESSPKIKNCFFKDNDASPNGNFNTYGGGVFLNNSSSLIENCIFTGNKATNGGALGIKNASPTIKNCLVYKNNANKISNYGGNGGAAHVYATSKPKFINCTFASNTATRGGGAIFSIKDGAKSPNTEIRNAVFWGNSGTGNINLSGGSITVKNSILQNKPKGNIVFTDSEKSTDVNFEDGTSNYMIKEDSKAVDAADEAGIDLMEKDVYGNPRIEGFKLDIGAIELKERSQVILLDGKEIELNENISVNYGDKNPNTPVGKEAVVNEYSLNITLQSKDNKGNYKFTPSGHTYRLGSSDEKVAEIDGQNIIIKKVGTTTISIESDAFQILKSKMQNETRNRFSALVDRKRKYKAAERISFSLHVKQKELTISGVEANDKVYDGKDSATIKTNGTLDGVVIGDNVSLDYSSAVLNFSDKNVGQGKAITVSNCVLTGADKDKYTLIQPTGLKASITKKDVRISNVEVADKLYDGTTTATLTSRGELDGVVAGETIAINATAINFSTKDVGTDKDVAGTFSIAGTGAENYNLLAQPTGLTANITKKEVTVTGVTVADKEYDGSITATFSNKGTLDGVVDGEDVSLVDDFTANFDTKDIGVAKPISLSVLTLEGADKGNYELKVQPTGVTASITAKALTVKDIFVANKVYDGTKAATVSSLGDLVGILNSENVTLNTNVTVSFNDKNVGTAKAITLSAYQLEGSDKGNYTIAQPTGVVADITKKDVSVSVKIKDRPYDATTVAKPETAATLLDVITGDDLKIDGSTVVFNFVDKEVEDDKQVIQTGSFTLNGTDKSNYNLIQPTNLTATIIDNTSLKTKQNITWTQSLVLGCGGVYELTLTATSDSGFKAEYTSSDVGISIKDDLLTMKNRVKGTVKVYFPGDDLTYLPAEMTREVEFKLEGLVRQKWGDTLFFDNVSKDYVKWEWFKNNALVQGQNKQYYSEKQSLNGVYYAVVTDVRGDVYETCPIVVQHSNPLTNRINVYPNPVELGADFNLSTSFSLEDLENAKIAIYDITGNLLSLRTNVTNLNVLSAPGIPGMYIIALQLQNGTIETRNLIVK